MGHDMTMTPTLAPMAWTIFAAAPPPSRDDLVALVNRMVNHAIDAVPTPAQLSDPWRIGPKAGWCHDYAVTKRDADHALGEVDGITRVLLRPPAILGPGPTSTWNTLRPDAMRDDEPARSAVAAQTFAWVHLDDLGSLAADLASRRVADAADAGDGPLAGACVPLNVAAAPAIQRDYVEAVAGALGVDPVWEQKPAWTGRVLADRAHGWGWTPTVDLTHALAEIVAGLSPEP